MSASTIPTISVRSMEIIPQPAPTAPADAESQPVSRIESEIFMSQVRSFLLAGQTSKSILDIPLIDKTASDTPNHTRRLEITGLSTTTCTMIFRDVELMRSTLWYYPHAAKIDYIGQTSTIVITQPGALHQRLISSLHYLSDILFNQRFYTPSVTKQHYLYTKNARIGLNNLSQPPCTLSCDFGLLIPGHLEPFLAVLITETDGREYTMWKARRLLLYTRALRFVVLIHLVNELGPDDKPDTTNSVPHRAMPLERFRRATVTVITRTLKPVRKEQPTPIRRRGRDVAVLIDAHEFWPLVPTASFPLVMHGQGRRLVYVKFKKLHDIVNHYYNCRKGDAVVKRFDWADVEFDHDDDDEDEEADPLGEKLYLTKLSAMEW